MPQHEDPGVKIPNTMLTRARLCDIDYAPGDNQTRVHPDISHLQVWILKHSLIRQFGNRLSVEEPFLRVPRH